MHFSVAAARQTGYAGGSVLAARDIGERDCQIVPGKNFSSYEAFSLLPLHVIRNAAEAKLQEIPDFTMKTALLLQSQSFKIVV